MMAIERSEVRFGLTAIPYLVRWHTTQEDGFSFLRNTKGQPQ